MIEGRTKKELIIFAVIVLVVVGAVVFLVSGDLKKAQTKASEEQRARFMARLERQVKDAERRREAQRDPREKLEEAKKNLPETGKIDFNP